jgi:hypothetical protein
VVGPEVARSLCLIAVCCLLPSRDFALAFVVLHGLAQMFQSMTVPARVTIYRLNYPASLRGKIVGHNRQVQFVIAAAVSLLVSALLDGRLDAGSWFRWLGGEAPSPAGLVVWLVPAIGFLGLLGTFVFGCAPVRELAVESSERSLSLLGTLRQFGQVWREDRDFRRYESFFFIFGFANIMTIPLTQIHVVDRLGADYWDLAMINVAIVQGLMALTMPTWGKLVDRHSPSRLRGFINLIFALDFLALAIAPSIGWVYVPIYLGLHTVLTGVRWALAPFAGVWLKRAFNDDARPVFAIVYLVVVGTALLMIHRPTREAPRPPLEAPPMPAPRMTGA